jgi:hypothetical protein
MQQHGKGIWEQVSSILKVKSGIAIILLNISWNFSTHFPKHCLTSIDLVWIGSQANASN